MTALTIQGISKSFDGVQALQATDLVIASGKFTTLLGPSGCGKTTLLRMIAGLETPDQGELRIANDILYSSAQRKNVPPHRRGFGMVFQEFALWPHLTVFENVAFSLRASGQKKDIQARVLTALEQVRLQGMEQRYPHQLSGGQQQRVAFARAIVMQPRLILFDEPLSALDAILRDEMRTELMNLVQQLGVTALYVTHDQTEAMAMSDEIIVMQSGSILQRGTPEQIYRQPSHPFVARFIGHSNWIDQGHQMVRPEHIRWHSNHSPDEHIHTGMIQQVSYMGDRYEIQLDMGEERLWTAYQDERMTVGEQVTIYISAHHVHTLNPVPV